MLSSKLVWRVLSKLHMGSYASARHNPQHFSCFDTHLFTSIVVTGAIVMQLCATMRHEDTQIPPLLASRSIQQRDLLKEECETSSSL